MGKTAGITLLINTSYQLLYLVSFFRSGSRSNDSDEPIGF